jgi:hypothetical protein
MAHLAPALDPGKYGQWSLRENGSSSACSCSGKKTQLVPALAPENVSSSSGSSSGNIDLHQIQGQSRHYKNDQALTLVHSTAQNKLVYSIL